MLRSRVATTFSVPFLLTLILPTVRKSNSQQLSDSEAIRKEIRDANQSRCSRPTIFGFDHVPSHGR